MFFAHFVPSLLGKHASIHYSLYHGIVKMNAYVISVLALMSLSRCESKFKGYQLSALWENVSHIRVFVLIKLTPILAHRISNLPEDYAWYEYAPHTGCIKICLKGWISNWATSDLHTRLYGGVQAHILNISISTQNLK